MIYSCWINNEMNDLAVEWSNKQNCHKSSSTRLAFSRWVEQFLRQHSTPLPILNGSRLCICSSWFYGILKSLHTIAHFEWESIEHLLILVLWDLIIIIIIFKCRTRFWYWNFQWKLIAQWLFSLQRPNTRKEGWFRSCRFWTAPHSPWPACPKSVTCFLVPSKVRKETAFYFYQCNQCSKFAKEGGGFSLFQWEREVCGLYFRFYSFN